MDLVPFSSDLRNKAVLGEFLHNLPRTPGVYIMKDENSGVIYVGKAINIKNRVTSYFRKGGDTRFFVPRLEHEVASIEILMASSEKEALLLENNLIKEFQPKYNVNLRDDKSYPGISVDVESDFPRFRLVRGLPKDDENLYFGPYNSSRGVKAVLSFIHRHFRFRTCSDRFFESRRRPCLQHHMGRCAAPCCGLIEKEAYRTLVDQALMFVRGENEGLLTLLSERMMTLSENMEYEQAGAVRDTIIALKSMIVPQSAVSSDFVDRDVIGMATEEELTSLVVLEVRRGSILSHRQTIIENPGLPADEMLEMFVIQHYFSAKRLPAEIIVPDGIDLSSHLKEIIEEKTAAKVSLRRAKDEHLRSLMDMAVSSARNSLRLNVDYDNESQLRALATRLKMRFPIHRMECYDISHFQGANAVGSMVVFMDGEPARKLYRTFKLRRATGGDDYGALKEVMERRLAHAGEKDWEMPDLMVIDGGKSQLQAVLRVFAKLGISYGSVPPAIIALAKERDRDGAPDRIFLPGVKDPLPVRGGGRELLILSKIRDEAHDHAITSQRLARERDFLRSSLENLPGIGKKRAMILMNHFRSIDKLAASDAQTIGKLPTFTEALGDRVLKALKTEEPEMSET
ncbi:excinuclease ABC subunit UvrC [Myxococcota bacterium]|nr:excinuclease ABC subunit UvrC [Myxococcota bacterium]MBU1496552.1 excinuclease ABC subunit UvrC [Myxococcota bacterium]